MCPPPLPFLPLPLFLLRPLLWQQSAPRSIGRHTHAPSNRTAAAAQHAQHAIRRAHAHPPPRRGEKATARARRAPTRPARCGTGAPCLGARAACSCGTTRASAQPTPSTSSAHRHVSGLYGRRDETCPVSTEGGTRRVQLVREGGVRGGRHPAPPAQAQRARHDAGRVQITRQSRPGHGGGHGAEHRKGLREALPRPGDPRAAAPARGAGAARRGPDGDHVRGGCRGAPLPY